MGEKSPTGRLRTGRWAGPPPQHFGLGGYLQQAKSAQDILEDFRAAHPHLKRIADEFFTEEPLAPVDYSEIEKRVFAAMTGTPTAVGADGKAELLSDFYRKG